jgi:hypothetical protein
VQVLIPGIGYLLHCAYLYTTPSMRDTLIWQFELWFDMINVVFLPENGSWTLSVCLLPRFAQQEERAFPFLRRKNRREIVLYSE